MYIFSQVESRKGDVCYLSGQYYHDKLKDKCRIYFADESWLEGYFKGKHICSLNKTYSFKSYWLSYHVGI